MDDGNPISGMVIILLLILFNAIIVSAKNAINNVNENSVKRKAESGQKTAGKLLKIIEKPSRYVNVMDLLQSFIGVLIGMTFITYFLPGIEAVIVNSKVISNINIIRPVYYVLLTILLVYITVLFGLILPRRFATRYAEVVAYHMVGIIRFLGIVFYPVAWLLEALLNIFLRIFGIKPFDLTDNVTEEEIISMVNEGQEQGVLDAGEVEMISNIMELGDKEAQDIMTPKKRIVAVNAEMSIDEALHFMLSENYSRYPLYEGNRDNIIGILHMKDVICAYISEDLKNKPLCEIAREPYFVPDTMNINILFRDMQLKNIHMAIVIDEYGQTAGLVALEDFLEEIVGNIQDEYDEEESMIISSDENNLIVKGSISLEELEDELDIILHNEDFDTLNGLLISLLARIPGDGEQATLTYQGYQFDVLETRNKMTHQVRISKLSEPEEEHAESEEVK
ncbi:MAG TPA: hemolysin family protein [Mobilitalea sp.]|nr:hemolysin family protein [Mobilitalea sp.]